MDILDALQDIRARNARNERMGNSADLLGTIGLEAEDVDEEELQRRQEDEEDERLVREVFSRVPTDAPSGEGTMVVKRKAENLEAETVASSSTPLAVQPPKKRRTVAANSLGIKLGKGKAKAKATPVAAASG